MVRLDTATRRTRYQKILKITKLHAGISLAELVNLSGFSRTFVASSLAALEAAGHVRFEKERYIKRVYYLSDLPKLLPNDEPSQQQRDRQPGRKSTTSACYRSLVIHRVVLVELPSGAWEGASLCRPAQKRRGWQVLVGSAPDCRACLEAMDRDSQDF